MKIITTVGTSIFSNCKKVKGAEIDTDYNTLEKKSYSEWNSVTIQSTINRLKGKIDTWANGKETASAEIASIIKIQEELKGKGINQIEVYLICTETILSRLAAECILNYFNPSVVKSIHVVEGLKLTTFEQSGFDKLISKLNDLTDTNTIYNISGGYKALIPVLTILAQIKNVKLNYIYEDSNDLIEIESLPLSFDWNVGELYADFITDKDVRTLLSESSEILKKLRSLKIIKQSDRELTILGSLLEKYINDRMFEGKTSFGYFAEYKVFESFIINPYLDFKKAPVRGEIYWWNLSDKTNYTTLPQFGKDKDKEIPIEIDLTLEDSDENKIWIEVKSYSKNGLNKAISQIKQRLEFNRTALKSELKEFFLVLYKFDFQTITESQQTRAITKLFDNSNTKFKIWYFNVPANLEKDKVSHKAFFESKIIIHPFESNS